MGNVLGNSDGDEEVARDEKEEDESLENDHDPEKTGHAVSDLSCLFDHSSLRTAASKIRDNIPENIVQQHHNLLVRWLEERRSRNEDTVSMAQFCDMLMSRSVGREECYQAFQQFDSEGEGEADVAAMLDALKTSSGANLRGELSYVIRTLQACSLTPGFIDVYIENPQGIGQHGARILNFLLRNRAASSSLSFPLLDGFNNTTGMRLAVLRSVFKKLCESDTLCLEKNVLTNGEELKPIPVFKCFSSVEVSSNHEAARCLTDNDSLTYWQSDGSARSHFIRIKVKPGVVIKQLHMNVCAGDQSYMPQLVVVSVGKSPNYLREIKEVRIPGFVTGDVLVVENLSQHYTYISLNIRRCHNDGCDTRIHGLKILGYRVVRETKVSVLDASAVWYLQILTSTVMASLPVAPNLRSTIIEHTKIALHHIGPLSLTPYSGERPAFLSGYVLAEINRFIQEIASSEDNKLMSDGMFTLLSFNLARGHVIGILSTLKILQDNTEMELKAHSLLKSLVAVRENFQRKQGGPLQMLLSGCDGGCKDDSPQPESVLTSSMTSQASAYNSADGKTKVNMVFKVPEGFVQISKIRVKVVKGPKGPKCGLAFVYNDSEPFNMDEHVERFKQYDAWNNEEMKNRLSNDEKEAATYFHFEDDWDEAEIYFSGVPSGQYVFIKFLQPREESADRLGIVGLKFYGFTHNFSYLGYDELIKLSPLPQDEICSAETVVLHTLFFLVDLAREQSSNKKSGLKPQTLDMSDVTLKTVWQLYDANNEGQTAVLGRHLILSLLHSLLQHFDVCKTEEGVSQEVFDHLCHLVDAGKQEERIVNMAKQIIIDGAVVFFPDKEARRKQLFNMMNTVNGVHQSHSTSLIFQSLCQFFSSVDPSSLLNLPQDATEEFNVDSILNVMDTLVSVATKEFSNLLEKDVPPPEKQSHLVMLLNSLQTSLLVWCKKRLVLLNKEVTENVLVKYCSLITEKATEACRVFRTSALTVEEKEALMAKLETTFLATVVRQMILCLTDVCAKTECSTKVQIAQKMMPLAQELREISSLLPNHFYTIDSELWKAMKSEDVVLRVWEEESPHNYHNNQHMTKIFSCPGASTFIVEFDTRSETEKRYDYLEFTDSLGVKTRYDQSVGTDKWPKTVNFKGGHRLQFLFHSDSSNNEWGYKFRVTAKGCPDVPLCWMFDLQLGLAKLFGKVCGSVLSSQKVVPAVVDPGSEEESQALMLKSELWTTLFRGGFMVNRLQRSLSGIHESESTSSIVNNFLCDMVEGREGTSMELISKCREQCNTTHMGGSEIDGAVEFLFAALIWHTQPLREEAETYVKAGGKMDVPEGIHQAYTLAETLRIYLIEMKQKKVVAEEKNQVNDLLSSDPVTGCKEKACFLLKFAGLTKVQLKQERGGKVVKHSKKNHQMHKRISVELDKGYKFDSLLSEKYPAFKLVMEFVRNPIWSKDKVQLRLQERSKLAHAVSDIYMLAAEFIRISKDSHIFQVPNVLFLQELLVEQSSFPKHYADMLDGCGLALEAKVRQAYYTLVRRLVDSVQQFSRPTEPGAVGVAAAFDYIQISLLHLLDIDWQLYDLTFLLDIDLPSLLFSIAKSTVTMRDESVDKQNDETKELAEYEQCLKWFDECKQGFVTWFNRIDGEEEEKRAKQMFVARFSDLLDVEINCDGCDVTLPGPRYRCLQCEDKDLCSSCYMGGVKPGGGHTEEHEFVHLMYKCDECRAFIAGTRFHCMVCEDFDLCLGCHKKKASSNGHTPDHEVVKVQQVKLKSSNKTDTDLQAYIHQHVWLQFSGLTLSMAGLAYSGFTEKEYATTAVQLLNHCLNLVTRCLQHEPVKKVDGETDTTSDEITASALSLKQEEAFALHSQEKIMGLLGATIPLETKENVDGLENSFETHEFLMLLLKIIRGETGHEVITQHMAMGLIGRLLQRFTDEEKIRSIKVSLPPLNLTKAKDQQPARPKINGLQAKFLAAIKDAFNDKPEVQLEFYHDLAKFKSGEIDAVALREKAHGFLENHSELQNSFDLFLAEELSNKEAVEEEKINEAVTADSIKEHDVDKGVDSTGLGGRDVVCVDDVVLQDKSSAASQLPVGETFVQKNMVQFLFSLGATCLERSGLEWACSVARMLQQLLNAPGWKVLLLEHVNQSVIGLNNSPELASIFALFVLAGFPEVLSVGVKVKYHNEASVGDSKQGVVLKHFTDKHQSILVDCKNRRRQTMSDELMEVVRYEAQGLKEDHTRMFITIIKDIIIQMKSGATVAVETLWVLSLSLKCLLKSADFTTNHCQDLFTSQFIQCLVYVSSKGTGFSKQWLLKDLEILSLMLFSRDKDMISSSIKAAESGKMSEYDPWRNLDDTAKICFQTLHENLNIPIPVLRAIYDMHGQSTNELLVMVRENLFDGHYHPSNSIREMAKKWEAEAEAAYTTSMVVERIIDTGVQEIISKSVPPANTEMIKKAVDEASDVTQRLITAADSSGRKRNDKKSSSAKLLKKELEDQGKAGSKDYLTKVNMAMSILYARKILLSLLAEWPASDHPITAELLGCKDTRTIPCILDILNSSQNTEHFQKVINNVILHCCHDDLVEVVHTACQFLEEVNLATVTKESEHNYKNNTSVQDKIHMPGASYLSVRFDSRCATEVGCDELVISSSEDFRSDRHVFSGSGETHWHDFEMQGNTLYYKFTSDSSNNDWGFKFTVSGGWMGRFDTGYMILNGVLEKFDSVSSLPVDKLWKALVYISCQQVGAQRLKTVELLLRLIQAETRQKSREPAFDLNLLHPLWQLYNKVSSNSIDKGAITLSVVRALTELFLQAENLAMQWNVVNEYIVALHSNDIIKMAAVQGIKNVAALGLMIGMPNIATKVLMAFNKTVAVTTKPT